MKVYVSKCKLCGDVMVSYCGRFSECTCKAHYLDGDDYIYRIGGDLDTMTPVETFVAFDNEKGDI